MKGLENFSSSSRRLGMERSISPHRVFVLPMNCESFCRRRSRVSPSAFCSITEMLCSISSWSFEAARWRPRWSVSFADHITQLVFHFLLLLTDRFDAADEIAALVALLMELDGLLRAGDPCLKAIEGGFGIATTGQLQWLVQCRSDLARL